MAYKHTPAETLESKDIRGREMARTDAFAIETDYIRVAVDDIGILLHDGVGICLQRIFLMKPVARIEKYQIVAFCLPYAFVHCIVKPLVRLADKPEVFAAHTARDSDGVVGGGAVDNQMLEITESLSGDRLHCERQRLGGIICDGHNSDEWSSVHIFSFNLHIDLKDIDRADGLPGVGYLLPVALMGRLHKDVKLSS